MGLADLVRSGQVTPEELLETAIVAAEASDPAVHALSQKLYDHGREALCHGTEKGAFAGVPFLLKDIGATLKGTVTTQGSRFYADQPPAEADSTLTARYKRAGLVIFGKTTTPEMALAASTEGGFTGTTRNPWALDRTAGGSSGGAAAAVAAGIVPAAHASDGGGSIRIPASCCGLFGLKPTRARTPAGPYAGEGWGSLSVNHVLTRSVRDSAALLDATQGYAPGDPYCAPAVERPYLSEIGQPPGRLRIALQRHPLSGVPVDPECSRAAEAAAHLLADLGHDVEEAQPPGDWEALGSALWTLVSSNVSATLRKRAAELGRPLSEGDVDPVTWNAVTHAATLDVDAYPDALSEIHMQGRRMAEFHAIHDVILSPTLARPPVLLGTQRTDNPDLEAYGRALAEFSPFTQLFNITGQPSMSVPLHWSPDNLPIGVMFSARFGDEALLFRLASQLEQAKPWFDRVVTVSR
ncbi:amidase [Antarcticimicrobium luteum]|uniref:amidase n=1 Tax=Antarcticimicrobium luteum TaxID=2547397 RepID=UPI001981A751|nr:amidase [Antarcticimicrobium luteum]